MRPHVRPSAYGFLTYLALHALAIAGVGQGRFPDSASYEILSVTGDASRLPTVPLVYWLVPNDVVRVTFQVVLAAVSWWALAWAAGLLVRDARVRIAIRLVLLAIGLAAPVVSWNSLILSESISLSLTALAIAAWLQFARRRDATSGVLVVAAMVLWTFARQPHVLFAALVALAAIAYAALASGPQRRVATGVAAALVVATAVGFFEIQRNQTISRTNVASVIQQRILPNRDWTLWFVRHGMPYSREIAGYAGVPFNYQPHDETDRRWVRWINTHGTGLYLRFVLEHPDYLWLKPLPFFPGEQPSLRHDSVSPFARLEPSPTPSLLSPIVNYGRHRNVLPSVVDRILFDQGEIGDILVVLGVGLTITVGAWRRFGPDPRVAVPAVAAVFVIPQAYAVWLSGGEAVGELDRLSIVNAVQLRVALWILLALAVDRFAVRRSAYDRRA